METNCYVYTGLSYEPIRIKENLYDSIDVFPGDKVVIKPNWVREGHAVRKDEWEHVITHPAVVEAVLDIVLEKLKGTGEVVIADCPVAQADFEEITKRTGIREIVDRRKGTGTTISILDLRQERLYVSGELFVRKEKLPGDPLGYILVNLGEKSEFYDELGRRYYGADYDLDEVRRFHNESDNIYGISKTILSADILINLSKLKTHRYAGITAAMKNMVGTVVLKNSIPHHSMGTPEDGGDAYPKKSAMASVEGSILNIVWMLLKSRNPFISYPLIPFKLAYTSIFSSCRKRKGGPGEWYGNDTIWRSIVDINKIILYGDKEGKMHQSPQRRCCCIVDGIYAGEGSGPVTPDKKELGIIIAGKNPLAVDTVASTLMGFDYKRIPSISGAYNSSGWRIGDFKPDDITIMSDDSRFNNKKIYEIDYNDTFMMKPHAGWAGHIELNDGRVNSFGG